jgi:glycosidase
VNADYAHVNVESERRDPHSLLNYYRQLIVLRHASPALRQGTYRPLNQTGDVFAYERAAADQRLLIALNFASRPAQIKIDGDWSTCLSSVERVESKVGGILLLAANEAVILEQRVI